MNKEEIMNKIQLYEFCENMEELYDDYYVPLQQENKQLKEEIKGLKMIVYGLNNRDLFPHKICEYINKIEEEINWEDYLKFQGDSNDK